MLKEADQMDIPRRSQLHARDGDQSEALRRLHKTGAVAAAVVVGQGNEVQSGKACHARDVAGGHIRIGTGGQAGVNVKIVRKAALHVAASARQADRATAVS